MTTNNTTVNDTIIEMVAKAEATANNPACKEEHNTLLRALKVAVQYGSAYATECAVSAARIIEKYLPKGWWLSFTGRVDQVWAWFQGVFSSCWQFLKEAWNNFRATVNVAAMDIKGGLEFPFTVHTTDAKQVAVDYTVDTAAELKAVLVDVRMAGGTMLPTKK